MPRAAGWFWRLFLLAATYLVAGRLGLLLAIPPGYATAVFAPAGVGLGAALAWGRGVWPGIWIGSFVLNLSISADPFTSRTLLIAAGIASGSTLQAVCGQMLLQRFATPLLLSDERSLLRFTLLAVVATTLVGASIGITTLYTAGALPASGIAITWFTWWVGDGIGVLLFTPMFLMAFATPRELWRRRLLYVAPWLLLAFTLVVAVFFASSRWETERLRAEFHREVEAVDEGLRAELDRIAHSLHAVERLFAASERVDRREFRIFVERILRNQPAVNMIEWVAQVPDDAVPAHVARMAELGHADFVMWTPTADGSPGALQPGHTHHIVSLIEPTMRQERYLGLDLGFDAERRRALTAAQATGLLQVTGRIALVQDGSQAVLAALAVADGRHAGDTIVAVLNLEATFARALERQAVDGLAISLHDLDGAPDNTLLHQNASVDAGNPDYQWRSLRRFGERRWELRVAADAGYITARRSWQGWLVLVGGLVVTALMGALLLLSGGRADRVERLVQERTRALQRSEGIYRAVIDASPDGILQADGEGRLIAANRSAERLFDAGSGGLLGRPLAELLPLVDLRALEPGAALRQEVRVQALSGEVIPVELTVTPVDHDDGRLLSCLLRDLRPRDELVRMKNEFIAVVSHELRTPLTSIRGALGLLAGGAGGVLPDSATQLVSLSNQNGERLSRLIDDLLDFEKLDAGALNITLQRQPLLPLLQQAQQGITGYLAGTQVSLRTEIDDDLPDVVVAGDRLVQVLLNLLSNAVKFSPERGVVTLAAHRIGDMVHIAVTDQGAGIAPALQSRVFSTFWQADSSAQRRHSGTGLGLAISKRLTERMGGQIGFRSTPGAGSVFWLEVPVAR